MFIVYTHASPLPIGFDYTFTVDWRFERSGFFKWQVLKCKEPSSTPFTAVLLHVADGGTLHAKVPGVGHSLP